MHTVLISLKNWKEILGLMLSLAAELHGSRTLYKTRIDGEKTPERVLQGIVGATILCLPSLTLKVGKIIHF